MHGQVAFQCGDGFVAVTRHDQRQQATVLRVDLRGAQRAAHAQL